MMRGGGIKMLNIVLIKTVEQIGSNIIISSGGRAKFHVKMVQIVNQESLCQDELVVCDS